MDPFPREHSSTSTSYSDTWLNTLLAGQSHHYVPRHDMVTLILDFDSNFPQEFPIWASPEEIAPAVDSE